MTYTGTTFIPSTGQTPQTYVDDGTTPAGAAETLRQATALTNPTSLADVASYQNLSVTEQIQRYNQLYGGSDNTQQGGLAASKSLNYANSPTIQQAARVKASSIPFTYKFEGQVGLFGAENIYYAFDIDIENILNESPATQVGAYFEAYIDVGADNSVGPPPGFYEPAVFITNQDPPPPDPGCPEPNAFPVDTFQSTQCCAFLGGIPSQPILNCYYAAKITNIFPPLYEPLISVELKNIGTGNIYIDTWLETMIYTRERKMWGYDKIYVRPRDLLYFGFHARNTRHLPYNVEVTIGEEIVNAADVRETYLINFS